jgi:hypothetical protein
MHILPFNYHFQTSLALTSSLIGAGVAYYSRDNRIWLVFAGTMFATWPYSMFCVMVTFRHINNSRVIFKFQPLSKQMMDTTEHRARDEPAKVLANLERWDNLQSVRTMLGLFAVGVAIYGMM